VMRVGLDEPQKMRVAEVPEPGESTDEVKRA
jgi:hypothetical protein